MQRSYGLGCPIEGYRHFIELVRCGLKTGAAKGVPLAETTVCVPLTWATRRVPLAGLQECTEGKGSRVGTADMGNQEGTTGGASGVY